jgi:hypothetical protein
MAEQQKEQTTEAWEREFLIEGAEERAKKLERMARDIRNAAADLHRYPGKSLVSVVAEMQHVVAWGMANLNMESLLRGASAGDLDRATRQ